MSAFLNAALIVFVLPYAIYFLFAALMTGVYNKFYS